MFCHVLVMGTTLCVKICNLEKLHGQAEGTIFHLVAYGLAGTNHSFVSIIYHTCVLQLSKPTRSRAEQPLCAISNNKDYGVWSG